MPKNLIKNPPKSNQNFYHEKITPEQRFREHWKDLRKLGRQTVESAWCVGRALVEIKAQKQHGEWLPWLEQEGVSHDISVRLMKLSTIQITQIAKFETVDSALKSLPKPESKKKEKEKKEKATNEPTKAEQDKINREEDKERLEIAEEKVEAKDAELEELKKKAEIILSNEPEDSIKTKIWNDTEVAKAKLEREEREHAETKKLLSRIRLDLRKKGLKITAIKKCLIGGVSAKEILVKYFGVALKPSEPVAP